MDAIYEFFRSLWVVWLGLIFLAIIAWALWPGNRKKFDHAANIPLKDDEPEQTQPPTQAKPKEPS
ncbi:MAG: cbb3-type cytochrome c oxidase subunit 3 [Alphaproteobacteria bacterium]